MGDIEQGEIKCPDCNNVIQFTYDGFTDMAINCRCRKSFHVGQLIFKTYSYYITRQETQANDSEEREL